MGVILDGERLTLADVVRVARGGERVEVAPDAIARVQAARDVVERAVERSDGVYGVTTGVGVRKRVSVAAGEMDGYNRRLLRDHRMAAGPTLRARSCAPPWCGSRTASRRAPRACAPSCSRASSTR